MTDEQENHKPDGEVSEVRLGDETIGFGTELSSLSKTFGGGGTAAMPRQATHGEIDHWVCYTVFSDGNKIRLWLVGGSDNAAGQEEVNEYVAEILPPSATQTERCPSISARFAPLRFDHGVQLGAPAADLLTSRPELTHEGDVWAEASSYLNRQWRVRYYWAIRVIDGRIVGVRARETVSS